MFRVANLVCLDAPFVAVAWQALFAQVFAIPLGTASRGALFLTTWAIYLLDRWADGASLHAAARRSGRQRFARRHARAGLALVAFVVAVDALLVASLRPRLLILGGVLGSACVAYLLVNRTADRLWRRAPVKELSIGVLFALGTVVALVPCRAAGFVSSVVLFGLLCASNCALIASWERELDAHQGKSSLATRWTGLEDALPRVLPGLALLAGSGVAVGVPLAIALPLATAALLLSLLHRLRRVLPFDERTALADLALLAPLVPALVLGQR